MGMTFPNLTPPTMLFSSLLGGAVAAAAAAPSSPDAGIGALAASPLVPFCGALLALPEVVDGVALGAFRRLGK